MHLHQNSRRRLSQTSFQNHHRCMKVAIRACIVKANGVPVIAEKRICTSSQQDLHAGRVAAPRRMREGRFPQTVFGVKGHPSSDELPHQRQVVRFAGVVENIPATVVSQKGVSFVVQEENSKFLRSKQD